MGRQMQKLVIATILGLGVGVGSIAPRVGQGSHSTRDHRERDRVARGQRLVYKQRQPELDGD